MTHHDKFPRRNSRKYLVTSVEQISIRRQNPHVRGARIRKMNPGYSVFYYSNDTNRVMHTENLNFLLSRWELARIWLRERKHVCKSKRSILSQMRYPSVLTTVSARQRVSEFSDVSSAAIEESQALSFITPPVLSTTAVITDCVFGARKEGEGWEAQERCVRNFVRTGSFQ